MYSYGLFAAGFVVVLLVSIACNVCISSYRHRKRGKQVRQGNNLIKNPNSSDENIQESSELSYVSSKYETINENDMVLNNPSSHQHREHARSKNKKCLPLVDQSYLTVIDGDGNAAPVRKTKITSCLPDTSSTSHVRMETTVVLNRDTNTDEDEASCGFMDSKCLEDSETSTNSNSKVHVKMSSASRHVDRKSKSIKERDYMNTYFTLNTSEMDNFHSYCKAIAPDTEFERQANQCTVSKKRHSCP